MSYIAYINGIKLELSESAPIAQTKQVNDIARLDNRQANFTNKFVVPPTANNVRAMEKVYLTGNQSNIPYQRNVFDLFDAETGLCMIYKGWANVTRTSDKGYDIHVYDGNIDFFKAIENKTLTDVGLTGLNHTKSLTNIVNSFNNTFPYMYILADYNGKTIADDLSINANYLVPSARISFIWDRIFQNAGFTYSGSFFATQDFLNLFVTYPKPIEQLIKVIKLIHYSLVNPEMYLTASFNSDHEVIEREEFVLSMIRENYSEVDAYVDRVGMTTTNSFGYEIPVDRWINILTSGNYIIRFEFDYNGSNYNLIGPLGSIKVKVEGSQNFTVNIGPDTTIGNTFRRKTVLNNLQPGDKIYVFMNPLSYHAKDVVDFRFNFEKEDGFITDFANALIDFKATDFVNEVMQRHGLTMFKDKYSNNIEFLTLKEILQGTDILDWSDKSPKKVGEKYIVGNYAQKNNFKYRYNGENENHNDGFIPVGNVNLRDENNIINSKIYSPEKNNVILKGVIDTKVFKIWNKEIKEGGIIEYKELTGRLYFLRYKTQNFSPSIEISFDIVGSSELMASASVSDYSRLHFQEIIEDYYGSIQSILDKSKLIEMNFYLKSKDVENFEFKKLIYVKQHSSYYLVNKIMNFIKGKPTKCELIEVDYLKTL